jgi:methionine-rich copper-binding protein CopC
MMRKYSCRYWLAAAIVFGSLSFIPSAFCHAVLVEVVPAADSSVQGPDVAVRLRFNVRVDRSRSRVTLVFSDGKSLQLQIVPEDAPDSLSARAKGLVKGAYRLRWQVLASDGHITRGEVPFQVSGP